jgi:hypothetical protein
MAHIKIPAVEMTRAICRREIDEWANSEDTRNLAFLDVVCQAFQNMVKEYYRTGPTPENRFERLDDIRRAITEIGFKDGGHFFTLAPKVDPEGRKNCDPPLQCKCGFCQ